jgi:hypothetical protein
MPRGRRPSTAALTRSGAERERNRHIDLTHTAFLACRDLLDANHRARHDLVKPAIASGNRTERFELSELHEAGSTCYKDNTETERCKTGKKQTVEDRVTSFEWVAVCDEWW